jgi:hypothetical protein
MIAGQGLQTFLVILHEVRVHFRELVACITEFCCLAIALAILAVNMQE